MLLSPVNGAWLEPSAFITQMLATELVLAALLPSRARADAKAILLPSGDQTGLASNDAMLAVSLVSGVGLVPSAFITQTFWVAWVLRASLPSRARFDANAILLPSGDQAGPLLSARKAAT